MTPTEYEKAKELAALWPGCLDTRQQSGVWIASDRLQDYLEAAEKHWPAMETGAGFLVGERVWWLRPTGINGVHIWSKGATVSERILSALLEAAKEGADA